MIAEKESSNKLFATIADKAIMGILAAVIWANVRPARDDAKEARAKADIRAIVSAINILGTDSEEWPGHWVPWAVDSGSGGNEVWDLNAQEAGLTQNDSSTPYTNWRGPYISNALIDPWGNPYFLDPDYDVDPGAGQTWAIVVGSFGPNGVGQNLFDSDDVYFEITR